eukprot:scaffold7549_cov111-Isochrysis_galbana.AAC.15
MQTAEQLRQEQDDTRDVTSFTGQPSIRPATTPAPLRSQNAAGLAAPTSRRRHRQLASVLITYTSSHRVLSSSHRVNARLGLVLLNGAEELVKVPLAETAAAGRLLHRYHGGSGPARQRPSRRRAVHFSNAYLGHLHLAADPLDDLQE